MANEAIVINNDDPVHYYTVDTGYTIPKGTLMVLSADPRKCTPHTAGSVNTPLGFAVEERLSTSSQTRIGVKSRGIIDCYADQAITLGDPVEPGNVANRVKAVTVASVSGLSAGQLKRFMGICLETASDGEQVAIKLML